MYAIAQETGIDAGTRCSSDTHQGGNKGRSCIRLRVAVREVELLCSGDRGHEWLHLSQNCRLLPILPDVSEVDIQFLFLCRRGALQATPELSITVHQRHNAFASVNNALLSCSNEPPDGPAADPEEDFSLLGVANYTPLITALTSAKHT
jgi:hypothetical protein